MYCVCEQAFLRFHCACKDERSVICMYCACPPRAGKSRRTQFFSAEFRNIPESPPKFSVQAGRGGGTRCARSRPWPCSAARSAHPAPCRRRSTAARWCGLPARPAAARRSEKTLPLGFLVSFSGSEYECGHAAVTTWGVHLDETKRVPKSLKALRVERPYQAAKQGF